MLMNFVNALPSTLEQGLIYALLAMGVLITYTILDFPDLSVDGTFPLGGVISTMVIAAGHSPLLALLAAIAGGAVAGLCTGLIHVKLKVRDLFSGIIVSTALYSINLKISGGKSLATIGRKDVTLFQNNAVSDFFSGLVGDLQHAHHHLPRRAGGEDTSSTSFSRPARATFCAPWATTSAWSLRWPATRAA